MRILLVGASGFIGGHLLRALSLAGHQVLATSRGGRGPELPGVEWQPLDLLALDTFVWPQSVDLLINASGLLSSDAAALRELQDQAASALLRDAAARGMRLLQISALGAGEQDDVPFLSSKAAADRCALQLGVPALVLRPSLVLGEGGASSAWLQRLSPWPLIPLLDNRAQLQPLHVDDLCAAVLALLRQWPAENAVLPLVGPQALSQGELIDQLRAAQGWPAGRYLKLPPALTTPLARLGDRLGWRALNSQTLRLAGRDNLGSIEPLAEACGYRAAPLAARLLTWPQRGRTAQLALQPLLLAALVLIWLGTALVCLGPGFDWGLRIMAEMGVHGWAARLAVIGGGLLDGLLGVALLLRRWRVAALRAQIALMLGYTLLISLWLPHYWFDPYMAVGKNLVLVVASLWLLWLERGAEKSR
ncbi:SDR family oxidoreductase [Pseudomonas mangrovi]|uniref:Epimerase n=1 Tax=Pseudomonas mangrovi TaxID=2161748 RepID=A0A2T5P5K9_9PSED|nr:SDR family oxidoreductase [Pseudomonas mangrovi]PTU73029.1 epimerase [Pseudomonas mangrovi]